jgi:hypothetical protein
MFNNSIIITGLLIVATALVGYASYHVTDKHQAETIENLHEQRRVAEEMEKQVEELLVREAMSEEQARQVLARWRTRYKYIPTTLNTADMVEYIESLTRNGFEQFDLSLASEQTRPDFSTRTYNVNGTAFYRSFYDLLWHLENNREFYRIHDLKVNHVNVFKRNQATGVDRRLDMVAFNFKLEAYHGGIEGISAPADSLMPVPLSVLHTHTPAAETFTPLVRMDLPPNDEGLVDVERARLISILGEQAIFEDRWGRHVLLQGDRVYLGRVTLIDPINAIVRADLNKGDRMETVNIRVAGTDGAGVHRTPMGNEIQIAPADSR